MVTLGITTTFKGTECDIEAEVGPAGCSFWTGTKSSAGEDSGTITIQFTDGADQLKCGEKIALCGVSFTCICFGAGP